MKIMKVSIAWLLLPLAFSLTACSGPVQTGNIAPTSMAPTVPVAATQPPLPSPPRTPFIPSGNWSSKRAYAGVDPGGLRFGQLQVMFAAKNTGSAVVSTSPVLLSATTAAGASLKWVPCMVTLANTQKKLSSASPFSGNCNRVKF